MCDPISLGIGFLGGSVASKVLTPKSSPASAVPTTDPAVERANAEAEAQQRANQQIAEDTKRRRGQQSLIAKGAPQPTLGDETIAPADGASPLGATTSRASPASNTRTSLISLGAAPAATMPYAGGGSSRQREISQAAY